MEGRIWPGLVSGCIPHSELLCQSHLCWEAQCAQHTPAGCVMTENRDCAGTGNAERCSAKRGAADPQAGHSVSHRFHIRLWHQHRQLLKVLWIFLRGKPETSIFLAAHLRRNISLGPSSLTDKTDHLKPPAGCRQRAGTHNRVSRRQRPAGGNGNRRAPGSTRTASGTRTTAPTEGGGTAFGHSAWPPVDWHSHLPIGAERAVGTGPWRRPPRGSRRGERRRRPGWAAGLPCCFAWRPSLTCRGTWCPGWRRRAGPRL